ncbi:type II secretion system F family protein [Cellulomonas dongxiuzhuiae]|uniref:Type II secretion system F family protein n=1 Tax=Cellulomonas dongxiuzhuiae TaxID=2819979 RepID=A0ABX8GG95_9CELL|nr:type II secretion system F family protein [Cellulomonas dongxiuzhuiae]MBO3087209.1 type II secretion system F family protein [Cellulomonas dongxiuzhuiae]MBO3090120.1 type II secretion system F family protein [Cellulomonas dongxiuzhuiae]MBO3093394.1 type II secretion system F family protein [Cellulomonas dongxiuzhuiae]QWC14541.1 type II secretion system F family protein [Cellulomonas dongxiuzhuiae]
MAEGTKTFEYAVRDREGKIVKGRLEATDQAAVANKLKSIGVAPVSIQEVATGGLNAELKIPGMSDRVKMKDLAIMARQMATMIDSGLSLLRALSIVAEQTENKALARRLAQVRNDVEQGVAFSVGLGKHPDVFPPLMINMVKAGEVGGFLDQVLISVADNFESEVKLRGQIKSAMTYPVVVFIIAILATVGMLLFIVPVFQEMFENLGGKLPAPTQFLVTMSNVMKVAILPLLAAFGVFTWWWSKHKNDRAIRERLDPLKLKIPVFGKLFQKVAVARFTRNFGTMLRSGVPILQALDIIGETSGNLVLEKAAHSVQESVRSGQSLSGPLSLHPVFPPMVVQMMAVGEDTGALDTMLEKVAQFYDQEVEATTAQLTSLIEPLMIVVIGGVVGGMIIALYLPIFSMFELVQ